MKNLPVFVEPYSVCFVHSFHYLFFSTENQNEQIELFDLSHCSDRGEKAISHHCCTD